jgi:histidinol-phosphate aminotransferase
MLEARAAIRNLQAYRPPLAGRQGLRLDFNESTAGCSPRVLASLRSLDAEALAKYPERESVEGQVATFLRLEAPQVLLTNGVDEAIHLLCSTFLEAGDEALIAVPTFAMYGIFAAAEGANVIEVLAGENFSFPLQDLLGRISERTRFIAMANPNNPTGAAVERGHLLQIAQAAPNAALLIDEAYFEFYGETVIDQIGRVPNLFVARTFSKAYGLAGLRCGILAGPAEQMCAVRRAASPYNVNSVALAVLPEALGDQTYVERYTAQVRHNREVLQQELGSLALHYWPSHANFVLVRIGEAHAKFVETLRAGGILVRDRNSDPGCDGCVRLTVGSDQHARTLISALYEVVEELGLGREAKA